jgi:quercetin dioxygenase-like cupin family protein
MSVRTLARKTGFSPSFMSQVENGQVSPSIGSMEKIAAVLGATLAEFFATASGGRMGTIVRPAERRRMRMGWSKAEIESLSVPGSTTQLEAVIVTMHPGGRSGKRPYPHPREVFAFILQGEAVLTLGSAEHRLRRGDAAAIPAGELRLWRNEARTSVRIMVVESPVRARSS